MLAISVLAENGAVHSVELERLLERLGEPHTAAALNTLLDNIELVAVIVAGLDGLARKGDTISDTIAEVITQARAAGQASGLDLRTTTHQLAVLIPALADATPAIRRLSESAIVDPSSIDVVGLAGQAMSAAYGSARSKDVSVGLRGVLKATKDPDVRHGLGFLVELARAFGQCLARHNGLQRNAPTPTA